MQVPNSREIVMDITSCGFLLRFDGQQQQLKAIEVYRPTQLRLSFKSVPCIPLLG